MRRALTTRLLTVLLLTGCTSIPPSPLLPETRCDPEVAASYERAASDAVDEWASEGGSGVVLVVAGGCIAFERAVGHADTGVVMTSDKVFDIGSLTKEFTAFAILELAAERKLSLDDTLADWFPETPVDKRDITLHQMLTHTSGLVDIADEDGEPIDYTPEVDFQPLARNELIARALAAPLVAAPGESFNYSNFAYSLLAAIIEDATGRSYTSYIEAAVFRPFGMHTTGSPPALSPEPEDLAVGFKGDERWGTTWARMVPDGPSWMLLGAGGMIAPAGDLYRWISGIAAAVERDDPVAGQFVDLFHEATGSGERYIVSFGSNDIYEAGYLWMIDRDIAVIALTNNSEFTADSLVNRTWKAVRAGASSP